MNFKYLATLSILVFSTAFGIYLSVNSWDGRYYVDANILSDPRKPAAIKRKLDISGLQGNALFMAAQNRLVNEAQLIVERDGIGIELGHFLTTDSGKKKLACDMYDHVTLIFEAEGQAVSGEVPRLQIDAPCAISENNLNRMAPIWVPVSRFVKEQPKEGVVKFKELEGQIFTFENMGSEWPTTWTLRQVKVLSEAKAESGISIERDDLKRILPRPLRMTW